MAGSRRRRAITAERFRVASHARNARAGSVFGTNSDGAGGYAASIPSTQPFDAVSEVALSEWNRYCCLRSDRWESGRNRVRCRFQYFSELTRTIEARTLTLNRDVFFGPISRSSESSPNQPIPRFAVVRTQERLHEFERLPVVSAEARGIPGSHRFRRSQRREFPDAVSPV